MLSPTSLNVHKFVRCATRRLSTPIAPTRVNRQQTCGPRKISTSMEESEELASEDLEENEEADDLLK